MYAAPGNAGWSLWRLVNVWVRAYISETDQGPRQGWPAVRVTPIPPKKPIPASNYARTGLASSPLRRSSPPKNVQTEKDTG